MFFELISIFFNETIKSNIFLYPYNAAKCKTVLPLASTIVTSASNEHKNFIISKLPDLTALCKGVSKILK